MRGVGPLDGVVEITGSAGPNCSSSTMRVPSLTSARIVGSKK